ncbi:MAG: sensor histidine kinase [Spirochaetes bacterium]|nr:sensor histidine kinase [Spirochaetota bacterium]MBU0955227.1 sensor histidine kinase [Spirochaetota bacterium]
MISAAGLLAVLYLSAYVASCSVNVVPVLVEPGDSTLLDLSGWDFARRGPARLLGNQWELYWRQLYEPADFAAGRAQAKPYLQPGGTAWNSLLADGQPLGPDGYATYRAYVQLPEAGQIYSFYMQNQDSAYIFWVNGQKLAQNGTVATAAGQYRGQRLPRLVHFYADSAELELVFQIANYTHKWGGLTNNIYLGLPDQMQGFVSGFFGTELFLTGAILIMAVYHLFIFFNRRSEWAAFWFALFCGSISLWYLFNGEYLFFILLPWFPLAAGIRLQYASLVAAVPLFFLFIQFALPDILNRRFSRLAVFPGAGLLLVPLFAPVKFFTLHLLTPFYVVVLCYALLSLYVMVRALLKGRSGSLLSFAGFLVLLAAILYDMAADRKLFAGNPLGPFAPAGLFVFILCESFIMARRFSAAYRSLDRLNRSLEQLVEKRTSELQQARELQYEKDKLAVLGTLVSGISHEIFNPLSGISGPLSIIRKELAASDLRNNEVIGRHLDYLQGNVQEIQTVIGNLNAVIRDVPVEKTAVSLRPLLERVLHDLQAVEGSGDPARTDGGKLPSVIVAVAARAEIQADSGILRQILNNLLANALLATGPEGEVQVRLRQDETPWVLEVSDSGCGMPAEQAARAFDLFFTARPLGGGSGIGLFLVRKFATSLGWQVQLESAEGKGTTVRLILG